MISWIDETIDGVANNPEEVIRHFTAEHLPTASKLVLMWEDDEGAYNFRASGMRVFDGIAMCEVTKAAFIDALYDPEDEADQE